MDEQFNQNGDFIPIVTWTHESPVLMANLNWN